MRTTEYVSSRHRAVEREIQEINKRIMNNEVDATDPYCNVGRKPIDEDYTFSDRLYTLIGERSAYKDVLGIK